MRPNSCIIFFSIRCGETSRVHKMYLTCFILQHIYLGTKKGEEEMGSRHRFCFESFVSLQACIVQDGATHREGPKIIQKWGMARGGLGALGHNKWRAPPHPFLVASHCMSISFPVLSRCLSAYK